MQYCHISQGLHYLQTNSQCRFWTGQNMLCLRFNGPVNNNLVMSTISQRKVERKKMGLIRKKSPIPDLASSEVVLILTKANDGRTNPLKV